MSMAECSTCRRHVPRERAVEVGGETYCRRDSAARRLAMRSASIAATVASELAEARIELGPAQGPDVSMGE